MADRKELIEERIEDIRQEISDSTLSAEEKNVSLGIVSIVGLVDEEVNDAHKRIDIRKAEYKELIDSMKDLSSEMSHLSGMLEEYARTSNNLLQEYSKKVSQIVKSDKKQNIFISLSLLVLSMSCATTFSGISILKAVWEFIMKLPL